MRTSRSTVALMILATVMFSPAAQSSPCATEPAFSRAAVHPGVVGVVERETIASNPLPWGASISVATTIWGGIRADRWKVSDRKFQDCPDAPASTVGAFEYDFRGADADWGDERNVIERAGPLTPEEALLLETEFGPAEAFPISGADRAMATVRMWGFELTAGLVVAIAVIAWLVRRRRRRRYDRTLF